MSYGINKAINKLTEEFDHVPNSQQAHIENVVISAESCLKQIEEIQASIKEKNGKALLKAYQPLFHCC